MSDLKILASVEKFLYSFARELKTRGVRFIVVALIANPFGLGCSYLFYKAFSSTIGIAPVSIISGIFHCFLTYSSHYWFTFGKPGNYLGGLLKVYAGAWFGMVVSSGISQYLIGTLKVHFFWTQLIILGFGATYSICINFLIMSRRFIYHEQTGLVKKAGE